MLQDTFRWCREDKVDSWVYLIETEDKVLSWALVYRYANDAHWRGMFWTRVSERRKGYGSRIIRHIQKDMRGCKVQDHDPVSIAFFAANSKTGSSRQL